MFAKELISRKLVVFFNGALVVFVSALATVTVRAQNPLGVDVSNHQGGSINWASVKSAGYTFAWAKATEGTTFIDADFSINEVNAKNAGVLIGAYDFAHPELNSPAVEAEYFWGVAGNYILSDGKSLMPSLDYETFPGTVVGASTYADWANLWCSNVVVLAAAQGVVVRPVIYISACNTPELSSENNGTIPWIANYNGDYPGGNPWEGAGGCSENEIWGSGAWDVWQYSSSATVSGITGSCDVDVFNGTSSGLISTLLIGTIELGSQSTNVTVAAGDTAALNVNANGSGTLSYQWQFASTNIPGATNSTLTITDAQLANAGLYTVFITNSVGNVSGKAFLSVVGPLVNAANSALDPSNMVNWWTGDGNLNDIYGTADLTPDGNLSFTNGKVGLAFRFDGSSAYMTSGSGEIAPPWTICGWVYHQRGLTPSTALAGDTTYALKVEQWSNTDEVGISHSGVGDYLFSPAYTLPLNTWTHLAFVATSSTVTLYANGVQKGMVSASGFELPRGFFGVDTFAGYPDDYMLGGIDELQIYTNALSASAIASIYNAGSAGLVRAPEFTSVTGPTNAQIQLNLVGMTGKTIILDSSTDLVHWLLAKRIANPTGVITYTNSATNSQTFYKAAAPY